MSLVEIVTEGRVALVALNRPEALNALSSDLVVELAAAFGELDSDPGVRAIVLTGRGRAFSAGADLNEMATGAHDPIGTEPDIAGIAHTRVPVVAAVNGLAVGGGLELALCCDIRFAADTATFWTPEVEHGLLPGLATTLLPRLVPHGYAMDLLLGGSPWGPETAHQVGLVQRVMPGDELLEAALQRAHAMAALSPSAVEGVVSAGRWWRDHAVRDHHDMYLAAARTTLATGDYREVLRRRGSEPRPRSDG